MANNYTQFSELIEGVTPEQAEWIEKVLKFDTKPYDNDEDEANLHAAFADLLGVKVGELPDDLDLGWWPGFEWSVKGDEEGSLWLHCDEGFRDSDLILFVQSFIRKFMPDYIFSLTAACFCDKPRIGEFGGVWYVITKDEVHSGGTWSEVEKHVEALRTGSFGPEID
jgi:hypothetical protein